MKLVANIVSIVLHPLLMTTYGMMLALSFTYLAIYPMVVKLILLGGVFFSTALVPGVFIFLMVKSGAAHDLELTDRRERVVPYLIMISSNLICLFFLYKMMMPFWLLSLMVAATVALVAALCINFFWKISAHLLGIGAVLGAIFGICRLQHVNAWPLFMLGLVLAGLLGTSRILLRKHTPMQAYGGFALGFAFTFVASLLSYIYLFI